MSKLLNRAKRKLDNVNYHYARIADDDSHLEECCFNLQQGDRISFKVFNRDKWGTICYKS